MCCNKVFSLIKSLLLIIALMVISTLLLGGQCLAQAAPPVALPTSIPTMGYTNGQQQLLAPDWSQITWGNLPPIQEAGWIRIHPQLVKKLGYDPGRSWRSGDRSDQVTFLGDVQDAFHLEAFKLEDISSITGLATKVLSLNDLELINWQTPKTLIKAIPEIGNLQINNVAPLQDLLLLVGGSGSGSIAQIVGKNKAFGNIPLGKLDLKQYNLSSISLITKTPIGKFKGWQQSAIASVPGLNQVPFSQFPVPLIGNGLKVGITDTIWSAVELGDPKVPPDLYISGTVNKKGSTVPVPCTASKPCSYIELSDPIGTNGSLHGKRWVSGLAQKVKGGFGPLKAINGGWEPTGKLVFGSAFKVVLTNTNESLGTANFALYFRACANIPFYGKSCTPYFIGGIPWFPTDEKGFVIVASTSQPNINIPSKYKQQIALIESENNNGQTSDSQANQSLPSDNGATVSLDGKPRSANIKIVDAVKRLGSFSSNVPGTDGGENACMWAVNNVLKEAGYAPLANDTLAVRTGQAALENGRGEKINIADAQAGDIVLVDKGGSRQHIGFCVNSGCTRTISNSSSRAQFSFRGNSNFSYPGSPYNGSTPQVYRLRK